VKGGYQVASRLATSLDEISMEAIAARSSRSRRERDRAFAEIRRLAQTCAGLLADALSGSQATAQPQ
jgi:hypothetical protein